MKNQFESLNIGSLNPKPKSIDIYEPRVIKKVVPFRFEKPDETVDIKIIECPHDTPEDTDFILKSLEGVSPEQALFVEQGSSKQKDSLGFQLKEIANKHSDIQADFLQRKAFDEEEFGKDKLEDFKNNPFAIASDYVASQGGKVVNMDLSSRIDQGAINFITQESSPEFAFERAYEEVKGDCFDYQETIPKVLKIFFPKISKDKVEYACQELYKTYHRSDIIMKRLKETQEYWYFLREKFMHQILKIKLIRVIMFFATLITLKK